MTAFVHEDNAWQATLDPEMIVSLNQHNKWNLSWQTFYDMFIADWEDGAFDWLADASIELARLAAIMYADRAWKTMVWFVDQGYDHIHDNEPTAVHHRLVAEGHLPKEDN